MTHTVHHARRGLAAAAFVVCAAIALHGSSAKFFQSANQTDFLKGDVESLSIDARGQLTLGPATEMIYETPSPFLWAVVPAPDGSLFIGTGNDGRVFRVDPQGKGAPFFDAAELEIHAIALAPDGGLYVGSSPDGKIYKVDRNGRGTTFFDPEEKYIWALTTDANGNVYAATGEKGVVYKIGRDGKGAPFYQTKATHATSLVFDKAGNLIVGTESPGRVLRVDASGKGFVLLDTPFQEIRSLRFDAKGMLFAAAVNGRATGGGAPPVPADSGPPTSTGDGARAPVPTVSVSTEITAIAVVDSSSSGSSSSTTREDRRTVKGAIYRIAPDGLWDQLWQSRDDSPYDLTFDAEGRLVVGTGAKGKIYRLEGDPLQPTLIARASAQQVTAMHTDARGRLYYATANPGKLFRLSAERSPKGTYESEVRDAQMVSTWGAISWRGSTPAGSRVELFSRTGNTETPDETWSAWSAAYTGANGSPITSPKARYLQWRAALSGPGAGPVLTSVSVAYLQRNLRPQVRSVTVHPPGIVFQKPYSTGDPDLAGFDNQSTPDRKLTQAAQSSQSSGSSPSLGRRTYQKGLQTLAWRADDENDDDLSYEVQYRREGETTWKVLRSAVTDSILVWDTATVPNGTYYVRVIASDGPSNAAETALTGELDSSPFDIDNTPPTITIGSVRMDNSATVVTFDVTDDQSAVQRAEISQDGLLWRSVFPADGIADSRSEHYVVRIEGTLGPGGVTLRVTDAMNNVVTTQVQRPAGR